jgi:hypothetical protein
MPTPEEDAAWTPYSEHSNVAIHCGPEGKDNRRKVVAMMNGQRVQDRIDVIAEWMNEKFRTRVINYFGFDEEAHPWLREKINRAAAAADAQASSEPLVQCSTVRLIDVTPEQVEWLWRERIAVGKLTLIVGDPGLGKSFLTLDIAARVSRGAAWPDSPKQPQTPGDVILLTAEDDLADTVRPRLDAHWADVTRIIAIRGAKFVDDGEERMVNLATDLDSIRRVAKEANQPRALIIDPVSAYLGKTDSHKNAEVRGVLAPLSELAAELRLAVIAVSHLRKGEGAALYRTMGSLAFIAAARSAWVVCRDETDQSRRLMLPLKSNLAPDVGGLAFAILPHGTNDAPVLCWEREPVSVAADDAIGHKRKPGPAPNDRTDAATWLREQLANGPRPAKDLIEDGDGLGFTERTLQRAFRDIGGQREKRGFTSGWLWSIAQGDTNTTEDTRHKQPVAFDTSCRLRTNPQKEEEDIKFLSNGRHEDDRLESVSPSDDFERERVEVSNGHGDVPF